MYNIAVIAGGNSGEYEVSLKTADNIFNRLDRSIFNPYLINFKDAAWTYTDDAGNRHDIDRNDFSLLLNGQKVTFDLAFIAIHGTPGENGMLQGYFEMIHLPYTGCGVCSSAITFNKFYCCLSVAALGVPVAPSVHLHRNDKVDYEQIASVCGYPCFVKPCNSGSSVGVSKVHSRDELDRALAEAFRYDDQLLVEQFIKGRELTCGVTSVYGDVRTLAVTEVVASNEFYDYNAKYTDCGHRLITPADLSEEETRMVSRYSETIFRGLDCRGVVRVDFILSETDGKPYFLEVNTIPGQTVMSIVPGQVTYNGLDLKDFYTKMIFEALPENREPASGSR